MQPDAGGPQPRPNCCGFCRNNRESPQVYSSHRLRDSQNRVTCPQLRRYICPNCGATGDDAHTRSQCPNVAKLRAQWRQRRAAGPAAPGQPEAQSESESGSGRESRGQPRPDTWSSGSSQPDTDLVLGFNRLLCNMGRVTNSRFNSAGRLRNRRQSHADPGRRRPSPGAERPANCSRRHLQQQPNW